MDITYIPDYSSYYLRNIEEDTGGIIYLGYIANKDNIMGRYSNFIVKYNGTKYSEILVNADTSWGWYNGLWWPQQSLSINNSEIWAVFIPHSGVYNLQKYDGTTWIDHTTDHGIPSNPHLVAVGAGNDVFVASEDTIAKYDGSLWKSIGIVDSTSFSWERPTGQTISMKTSPSGDLYVSVIKADSLNEIRHYNGSAWESFSIGYGIKKIVLSMAIDNDGTIYAGTVEGLYRVKNGIAERFLPENKNILPTSKLNNIAVDKSGYLWASSNEGIFRYDGTLWKFFNTSNGLPDNKTGEVICQENGSLWTTTSNGISLYDGNTWNNFTAGTDFSGTTIYNVEESPSGVIWIRTESGLYYYDSGSWNKYDIKTIDWDSIKEHISKILFDKNGELWIIYTDNTLNTPKNISLLRFYRRKKRNVEPTK